MRVCGFDYTNENKHEQLPANVENSTLRSSKHGVADTKYTTAV
jgi:hypothetical protein